MIIDKTPRIEKKPSSFRYYQEGPPQKIDTNKWTLKIFLPNEENSIEIPINYNEILSIPKRIENRRMVCVCNWSIRRTWGGIYLKDLFDYCELNVKKYSDMFIKQISIGTIEKGKYDSTIRLKDAIHRRAMLVYQVDGKELLLEQGFPLRLIDFGLYGYKGVKGLEQLHITNKFELGYWEQYAGYSLEGNIKPKKYYIVDLKEHRFIKSAEVFDF